MRRRAPRLARTGPAAAGSRAAARHASDPHQSRL